jgi:NADH-quinone oxidoreductase subunit C
MEQSLQDLCDHITAAMPDHVLSLRDEKGELILTVYRDSIIWVLNFLRDDSGCLFKVLIDICGVDFPDRDPRFEVVYQLLSPAQNQRLMVKVETSADIPVPSVTGIFSSAGWFEREVWDMFGISFSGHPDLRRILTDYGFEGHPLRKDFPLTGYVEVRYNDEQKRVVYEPVKLTQEFRRFDFLSPWEGIEQLFSGDKKAENGEESEVGES